MRAKKRFGKLRFKRVIGRIVRAEEGSHGGKGESQTSP
jgi:hypothetical protein